MIDANEHYRYAEGRFHRQLGIKFSQQSRLAIERVQEKIQEMSDAVAGNNFKVAVPPQGFLTKRLSQEQRAMLNALLTPEYAYDNFTQQMALVSKVSIKDNKEPMRWMTSFPREKNLRASFSRDPIHKACGEHASKNRWYALRESVGDMAVKLTRGLNSIGLMPYFQDMWRHRGVQEGLYLRRTVAIAREFDDPKFDINKIRMLTSSFTAPSPGLAGHMAGAAVDLRVCPIDSRNPKENCLELGNEYAEGGALSSLRSPYITYEQWQTRMLTAGALQVAGFDLLDTEDWHGNKGDRGLSSAGGVEMRTAIYGPIHAFHVDTGQVDPYNPSLVDLPLVTNEEMEWLVQTARERERGKKPQNVLDIISQFRAKFRSVEA